MSKVVVKYPRIWIQSQKKAEPCSCFSLRLLDGFPQFLWLLHLVCGPDEQPRCLLLFLPWMSSCASLFWNGSFGRREFLINLSAVTGEKTGITPQANPKYIYIHEILYVLLCVFCFVPDFICGSRIWDVGVLPFMKAAILWKQWWTSGRFSEMCLAVWGLHELCGCLGYCGCHSAMANSIQEERSSWILEQDQQFQVLIYIIYCQGNREWYFKVWVLLQCPDQIDS